MLKDKRGHSNPNDASTDGRIPLHNSYKGTYAVSMKIIVTGFAKRDHIPHFEMRLLQRSVRISKTLYAQSKSNVGVFWSEFFKKWHYYKGAYLRNGESFRLLAWDGIS